jgi:hypothetical protein
MKRACIVLGAVVIAASCLGQAKQVSNYQAQSRSSNKELLASNSVPNEPSESVITRYLGEAYGGGIIFYVDEDGKHGLITTTIDKSTRKQKKSETFIHTNEVRDGISTGRFNTNRLNAMKGEEARDSQVTEDYHNVYLSDWYLPTRYDLIKLYRNREVIGGYAEFAKGWKSTELSSVNEWYRSFITGGEFSNGKDEAVYIRVIRKF